MDLVWARNAIKAVAKQHGVTEEEVIEEIEASIAEARETAYKVKDKRAIAEWEKIPCVGELPTAYEFVDYLGRRVVKEQIEQNRSLC